MFKLVQQFFVNICFITPLILAGQSNNNSFSKENDVFQKEKKQLKEAFNMLVRSDEKVYETAHNLLKTVRTKQSLVNGHLLLAHYFKNKTLIDSSIFYANKALKYKLDNDSLESKMKSSAYKILGINYNKRGLFDESKKWHLKGIEAAEKYKEKYLYYSHAHGLGRVYFQTNKLDKALNFFKKCLEYKEGREIIFGSYINIGAIYTKKKGL